MGIPTTAKHSFRSYVHLSALSPYDSLLVLRDRYTSYRDSTINILADMVTAS